ncbi:MAG: DICT sensory domain-containing protein [Chloroflexaceae bacterium]
MKPSPITVSLFEILRDQLSTTISSFQASKATLVDISHTLEDSILVNRLPSIIFTGFQESSHWRAETQRYLELAGIASQVCIFAGGNPPVPEERHIAVTLAGDDPLRQEWFLLVLTQHFSAVLCGRDRQERPDREADRSFDTFLSFDPFIVKQIVDTILPTVARYRPDRAAELSQALTDFPPRHPDGRYMSELCSRIISHLERRYVTHRDLARELELARQYEEKLEGVIAELGVPVIPVLESVIVLPLIGTIDSRRAQMVMENLLHGIADFQADVAIIDITGVQVIDTAVADALTRAVKAASLLGARVILSGVSPRIATTLVTLEVDLSQVLTRSRLRESIDAALELRGFRIVPRQGS